MSRKNRSRLKKRRRIKGIARELALEAGARDVSFEDAPADRRDELFDPRGPDSFEPKPGSPWEVAYYEIRDTDGYRSWTNWRTGRAVRQSRLTRLFLCMRLVERSGRDGLFWRAGYVGTPEDAEHWLLGYSVHRFEIFVGEDLCDLDRFASLMTSDEPHGEPPVAVAGAPSDGS